MGLSWAFKAPMVSIVFPWDFRGVSMGLLWCFHGNFKIPWCFRDLPMSTYGGCMGLPSPHGAAVTFPLDVPGISMGLLWEIHGISMRVPWTL